MQLLLYSYVVCGRVSVRNRRSFRTIIPVYQLIKEVSNLITNFIER